MGDYAIKAQFEFDAQGSSVRRWLNNPSGIAGWWSDKVEGAAGAKDDEFHVTFPTSPVVFDLKFTSISDRLIEWHIAENPPWWKGTTISFALSETDGKTQLLFTHRGFEPDDPIIEVITPAWVRFLDNLVAVANSGHPNPAVVN